LNHDTTTQRFLFPDIFPKSVALEFDQRQDSSDGGSPERVARRRSPEHPCDLGPRTDQGRGVFGIRQIQPSSGPQLELGARRHRADRPNHSQAAREASNAPIAACS
jgi:hypothetical protein